MPTFAAALTPRRPPAFHTWAGALLALWLVALLLGPALLAATGLALNPHGHVHLYAHGHPFVDARAWWGIPNAIDVLSNAPLALAGLLGLWPLRGRVLPFTHGNVLPWAVVQFGGVALMVWAAWQRPAPGAIGVRIGALIAWYALAKVLELGDAAVFHASGEWVSGHSLKHLAAALAAWPVLAALLAQPLRQNAAGSGAARA
jgi:hypothetical protein